MTEPITREGVEHIGDVGEFEDGFPQKVELNGGPIHSDDARILDIVDGVTLLLLPDANRGLLTTEYLIRKAAEMAADAVRKEINDQL